MLALLLGCPPSFEHDQHDLVDLRVVGMSYARGPAAALVWDGPLAYSAVAPTLTWTGDVDGYSCNDIDVDTGADAADCAPRGTMSATVVADNGVATETGTLTFHADGRVPSIGAASVSIEGTAARVSLDAPPSHHTRWMAPEGEVEAVDQHVATFELPGDGVYPVVALVIDGLGGNDWVVVDVGDTTGRLGVGHRWIATEPAWPGAGPADWVGTVTASDDPSGFSLTDLVVDDGSARDDACGVVDGYWKVDSLVERSCGRDELLGVRVRVRGTFAWD